MQENTIDQSALQELLEKSLKRVREDQRTIDAPARRRFRAQQRAVQPAPQKKTLSWRDTLAHFFKVKKAAPATQPTAVMFRMPVMDDDCLRRMYFAERGIECPVTADERKSLAYKFYLQSPPDYEAVVRLFKEEEDKANIEWLYMLAYIYNNHEHQNRFFNPEIALSLELYMAHNNLSHLAQYNLATRYQQGRDIKQDIEEALSWYAKASSGMPDAYAQQSYIYKTYGDYLGYSQELKQALTTLYSVQATNNGSAFALLSLIASGEQAHLSYDSLINERYFKIVGNLAEDALAKSIIAKSMRCLLGLDPARPENLDVLFARMPKNNDVYINQYIIPVLLPALKRIEAQSQSVDFQFSLQYIKGVDHRPDGLRHAGHGLDRVIEAFENQNTNTPADLVPILWMVNWLATFEEWPNQKKWERAFVAAQAGVINISMEQIVKSTLNGGPTYNVLDRHGLPVLGQYADTTTSFPTGCYLPEPGIVALKAVKVDDVGEVHFDCISTNEAPAMLTAQDFDVAVALVFGNPDRIIWPSLSMEDFITPELQAGMNHFCEKIWSPAWLGYTDFGKTLYITDNLIASYCWNADKFTVADDEQAAHPALPNLARDLQKDILFTGGRVHQGQNRRVMLKPEFMQISARHPYGASSDKTIVTVDDVRMRVDGSYILKQEDGQENRLVSLNDTLFEQGRLVQKLTDRYSDISALNPVFERALQLNALFYALVKLRESRAPVSPAFKAAAQARLRQYESLLPIARQDLICLRLPIY